MVLTCLLPLLMNIASLGADTSRRWSLLAAMPMLAASGLSSASVRSLVAQ